MNRTLRVVGTCVVVGAAMWFVELNLAQDKPQEKPAEAAQDKAADKPKDAPAPVADTGGKKNPVKAGPEVLAEAKKLYGFDCSMCHGDSGDGKGELVESMKLQMKNWQESKTIEDMSDEAIYNLIVKGKDKMVGEENRLTPNKLWGLVHYVRMLGKKKTG